MALLGLDIGTSGCKCVTFDEEGKAYAYTYCTYNIITNNNGTMELAPDEVWEAVENAIKELVQQQNGSRISAICVTSFGESGVLIDKNGKALTNSILYADPRGEKQINEVVKKLGRSEIIKRSGHNPAAMYSVAKLMWIKENNPVAFRQAHKFLQYCGYALYKLTGEIKEEYSLCSRTLLFNVFEKKWDAALLSAAGLKRELFPEPIPTGTVAGKVKRSVAGELGLTGGVSIILGGHDQISAAVGCGVTEAGIAANGMGSVDCITPVFDKSAVSFDMQKYHYGCVPFVIDNHYVTYAFNFAGGALLKWYKDKFALESFEEMEEKIGSEPTGILVLPHIMGAATPYMDTGSTGAVVGMTIDTDKYTLYKSMMEAIAFEAKINIDCLKESNISINRLRACGGGSRSLARLQINSDLLGLPIEVLETEEAGALGAAVMAGAATGLYEDIKDGTYKLVKIKKTIYPNLKRHQMYLQLYEKYKKMYESVKLIYGSNSKLDN